MDSLAVVIALRLLHVVGGVVWVGGVILMAWFILPAQRAAGEAGGRFLQQLMGGGRLPTWLGITGGLTVLSGIVLYGRLLAATNGAWGGTSQGMVFGIGGAAALLGVITGMVVSGRAGRRMSRLGAQLQSGGAPDPATLAEMASLRARAERGAKMTSVLLLVATAAMAIARYS